MPQIPLSSGGSFNSEDLDRIVGAEVTLNGTQTLTNKTLTAPTITAPAITGAATIANGSTITTPVFPTGGVGFTNATSGTITLSPPTGALGTVTVTLPAATDTLVGKATTDTLTNKTLTTPAITSPLITGPTIPAPAPITTDSADAAITVVSGTVVFTKGSASAHTLGVPTILGQRLTLCAGSAQAHVITATGLIDDGVTGGSKTTMTLGSFIGATITLLAVQAGKWMVESKNVCVIT